MAARRQPGGGSKQEQLAGVDLAVGVTVVEIADVVVVAGADALAVDGVIDVVADGGVAVVVAVEIADDC